MRGALPLLALAAGGPAAAQAGDVAPVARVAAAPAPAFDGPALVDDALRRTRAMAYGTSRVDWDALAGRTRMIAASARDTVDLLPAYGAIVAALGDGHSFVNVDADTRAEYTRRHGRPFDADAARRTVTSALRGRSAAVVRAPAGRGTAAIVTVPALSGGGPRAVAYATTLHDGIVAAPACGYVVDLRGNGGGNQWPMVMGVAALLGRGPTGRLIDAAGRRVAYARIDAAAVTIADERDADAGAAMIAIPRPAPPAALARAPVAILTDDATGSSGEGIAVAFRGRPRTRSFGQTTYGAASSNEGFVLADGTNIVVTTAMMADARWRTYPTGLAPDEPTPAGAATMARALAWLGAQPPCRRGGRSARA